VFGRKKIVHKEREKSEVVVLPPEGPASRCNSDIGFPSEGAALPIGLR